MTERITVVGAGLMGQGIAVAFARAGHVVTVHDRAEALDGSVRRIADRIAVVDAAEGHSTGAQVIPQGDLGLALGDADIAIEAVPEEMALKLEVLAAMDAAAPPDTLFLTNTSSLPIDELRSALAPARILVAAHFFNPAEVVPGVEVAASNPQSDAAAQRVVDILTSIGKQPAHVTAAPGFIGNRLQLALFREAVLCVEEGLASPEQVDTIVRSTFGFRLPAYGPFEVGDMAGLQVYGAILDTLAAHYGPRFEQPESLRARLEAGDLGIATGSGYLDHSGENVEEVLGARDRRYRAVLAAVARDERRES